MAVADISESGRGTNFSVFSNNLIIVTVRSIFDFALFILPHNLALDHDIRFVCCQAAKHLGRAAIAPWLPPYDIRRTSALKTIKTDGICTGF
jgi:hypothetical protein